MVVFLPYRCFSLLRPACGERSKAKPSGEGSSPRVPMLRQSLTPQPSPRKSGARERTALSALAQYRLAALDDGDVARFDLGLERNHVAVLPQIHRHGLAGIDRRREPRDMLPESGRIVVRIGLQDSAAGNAVGAHAVQDRLWKAGALGKFGIRMQRIAVAAEPVDQRLIRTRRDID